MKVALSFNRLAQARRSAGRASPIGALLAASALCAPGWAWAEAASDAQGDSPASVSEVVVTAQHRQQSTLDVGIQVTEVSGERLQELHVQQLDELTQLTAAVGLRYGRPGGQPIVTIRGVGMNDFTVGSNPSTAVYVDNIYYPNIGTISGQMFDLEGAEILKGPQSTLYGRNATAGAIKIASARPTDNLSGYVMAGYGNYNTYNGEAAVSGPLTPTLLGRLSLQTEQRSDGYMDNQYPGGSDIGDSHKINVRAQLLWTPNDRWEARGIVAYGHQDDQPGAFTPYGIRVPGGAPGGPTPPNCPSYLAGHMDFANTCASSFGYQRPYTDPYTISENDPWTVKSDTFASSLNLTHRADGFEVRAITGYLNWRELYVKSDGLPTRETTQALHQRTWQASQELQILSTSDRPLSWIAGVYLARGNTNNPTYSLQRQQSGAYTNSITHNDATTETAQAYVQLDYALSPKLQVTAGVRYIYEQNDKIGGTWQNRRYTGGPNNGTITSDYISTAFLDSSIAQSATTWKIGINYKTTDASLLYASITHGFKSGGFVSTLATSAAQLLPYKGEDIYAYEVGAKQFLLDGRVQLSAGAFYYDYENLQTSQYIALGTTFINTFNNIPNANLKGFDVGVRLEPIDGLKIDLDAGFLDTYLGSFTSAGGARVPGGNQFANAPRFTGTAAVRYQFALTSDYDLVVGASLHRQGKAFADTVNTPIFRSESDFTLVNAHIDLLIPQSQWTFSIWGKNLTDDVYSSSSFANGSVLFATWNMPRTFGASLTKSF